MIKERDKLKGICEEILSCADLSHMAGLAVGVMKGEQVFTEAAGFRNTEAADRLSENAVFHCASISKTFTSTGIMKLVDEKKLNLQDRLVDLLPYLSIADERCEKIRVHHMLSHIAGIHDVKELDWTSHETGAGALKEQALSREVREMILSSDPDEGVFLYSDLGYDLLGLIIQEISGMDFEDFIAENLITPAGMENTTFLTFERTDGSLTLSDVDKAGMAMPHRRENAGKLALESVYPYSREHAPSSTLTSTVGDLLKWARFNMEKKAVSPGAYEKMWTERVDAPDKGAEMGMGWFVRKQGDLRFIGHEGGDVGFRTSFWMCPQADAAAVILSNTTEAPIELLNEKLYEAVVKGRI